MADLVQPPETQPTIRVIAMPTDTNPAGDIFGGWLMSQMDLAAGTIAARFSKGRASTVFVDGIQFHKPVSVGDEVSLYAEMEKVGRTSMKIKVRVWSRARHQEDSKPVTEGVFTFVALDENARPRPVNGEA